jgi:hypothetical protein
MKQVLKFLFVFSFVSIGTAQSYWQQEVNYTIVARLDDKKHEISAFEVFEYVNNSPNSLDKIYIHLWPNAYRNKNTALAKQQYKGGKNILIFGNDSLKGGIDSLDFQSNGIRLKWEYDAKNSDICILQLQNPLKSGDRIRISTPFKVKIPSGEISRLGHVGQSYQITQWYPKPAVYDKNGWNQMPYLNQGEFYSEFGSFDVSITLPKNYVVGATGDLQTESEKIFLNEKANESLKRLPDYLSNKKSRKINTPFPPSDSEWKTIRYTQEKVHDFAWFADKRYAVLKGEVELPQGKRKVTSWAMFVPQNAIYWQHAIEYINDGTYYYSLWNGDYPYNQVTAVDGTISAGGGMEYPNVTVIGNASSKEELEVVIVHEVGHNWFYGILGTNERVHGWMDEGMNTLNEMRYMQTKYPKNTSFSDMILNGRLHFNDLDHHDMGDVSYRTISGFGADQPIETHSEDFTPTNYGLIMYQKTGLVFLYLKDYLGEELFNKVMHDYFEKWKFKHPQPEDMRKTMEESSGKNLSWLFDDLIQTTNHIDYKIMSVRSMKIGSIVKVKNVGQVNGPITLNVFKDSILIETVWVEPGVEEIKIKSIRSQFTRLVIDDLKNIPEINRGNNTWTKKFLFPKIEPLKFEFLIGDNETKRTNVFWSPSIGGNLYDGLLIGAAFHNMGIPFKPFQYFVAPQFSFGRKNIAGMSEFSYTFLPKQNVRISRIGLSLKNFGSDDSTGSFLTIAPYWSLKLGGRGNAKPTSHSILIQTIFSRLNLEPNLTEQIGAFGEYIYNVNLPDHIFNFKLRGEYMQTKSNSDNVSRLLASSTYKYRFLKNKSERWLELRANFGNIFLYNNSTGVGYNYRMSMSGARGNQDLFMEEYNLGRYETSGIWSQQRMSNFGNFSSTSDFGSSSFWMASTNLFTQIPKIPKIIGVFADFGAFYDGATVHSMYNAGIGIRLSGILSISFPFVQSSNMGTDIFTNYQNKIRFTLKLNPVNKGILNQILN